MITIIAGSRTIWSYLEVEEVIYESGFEITQVVCGMAPGVDTVGEAWAMVNGIYVKYFKANWIKYGRSAGHIRNGEMANYGTALIAIWDGKSPGTKGMIRIAEERGLRIYVKIVSNESNGLFVGI